MRRSEGKVEPVQKMYLSKNEAMAYLGCSEDFLITLRNNAEIIFYKYRNTVWYDLKSIERFMNRNKVINV